MKVIEKYVDEINGREFKTKKDAIKSEKKHGGIKKLFSFWKEEKDEHCEFANGHYCVQRTDVDYLRLKDTLIKAINDYEPWIADQYKKHGGLQREYMGAGYMIGRYLCDGDSGLYKWHLILSNVCPKCFREWGQMYYATHCNHKNPPKN